MSEKTRHGFYSATAAAKYGSTFWSKPGDKYGEAPVEVTAVEPDLEGAKYFWPDKVYVGPVVRWVRGRLKNSGESGQAAIESALILPIFFFVVIGIFDFGQFLYFNSTLTSRLEAGARYAAVHGCQSPLASVCDPAVNVAITNTADGSGAPMLAHLSASDISASVSFHRSQDPTPEVPKPAWIANEEDRVTLSVSDYPIDLLFFPKFHRKASASQPIEWYQCYRDCK